MVQFKVDRQLATWFLLALFLACAKSALDWGFTYWQAYFLDGLTAKDRGTFWIAMAWLPAVLITEALLSSGATLANARAILQSRARAAAAHGTLLITGALIEGSERPDLVQTVVEDARTRAELEVTLSTGLAASLFTAALFAGTLATALPVVHIGGLAIPAAMLWIALALFGVTSFAMHKVGRALPDAETSLAQSEARLRTGIARLRENAMAAAMLDGRHWEGTAFERALGTVRNPALRIAVIRARLQALGTFFGPSDLLVLLLLSPFGNVTPWAASNGARQLPRSQSKALKCAPVANQPRGRPGNAVILIS